MRPGIYSQSLTVLEVLKAWLVIPEGAQPSWRKITYNLSEKEAGGMAQWLNALAAFTER